MANTNMALVQGVYEAFARGDVASLIATMAQEFRWIPAENSPLDRGAPYVGPQEVLQNVFMRIATEWEGFEVLPDRFLDAGDTVVMEGRYAGTYKMTGRRTNAQVVHVWVVRSARLIEFRQYADTAELQWVIGAGGIRAAQYGQAPA
jgi:ketosteroid isomerase-like protein